MDKFKVGDKVDRVQGLRSFQELEGGGPYTVTAVSPSARFIQINLNNHYGDPYPWNAQNFKLVEQDDPLPPAPKSVLYVESDSPVGTDAKLLVKGSKYGGLLFEMYVERKADGAYSYGGMRLDPDAALQLAHDLNRMANEIKRKEKQNA